MSEDRKAWANRVIERDPALANTLKAFRSMFGASVVKMVHADPELSFAEHLPWQSDLAIVPKKPFDLSKRKPKI